MTGGNGSSGGTGERLGHAAVSVAGVSALVATVITCVSIWLQSKNYRKPLLQRYVIRILLMVPIYSAASFASLMSQRAAAFIDPFRDVYEAFTIYTFLQLLINFIGGERALIILMHGRPPVPHLWPLHHVLQPVDISDPHTFLAIKRGILQYTWVKPMLAVATVIMKATGTYQEGYIGLNSGYLWSGLIYNISITVCLYALALFWVVMSDDLQPFRPMPKFLSIKGIIFASYWQGFFLSILVWLGALPDDIEGYTPDNLAAAIQDALICFEMPIFAVVHWYAFSWHDYADVTISAARMPIKFALRDAFGPRDLIEDTRETFGGKSYGYREFDASDDVLTHEDSSSRYRRMMQGMRYERGGRGKYWIDPSGQQQQQDARTPLLRGSRSERSDSESPGASKALATQQQQYGTADGETPEPLLDDDEEVLYVKARSLEFGDWNYPVITAHTASREDRLYAQPNILTASSNRHLLQPTQEHQRQRKAKIREVQEEQRKDRRSGDGANDDDGGNGESSSSVSKTLTKLPVVGELLRQASASSTKSHRSQRVDLIVEDHEAKEAERVRARKEGGSGWVDDKAKHLIRARAGDGTEEFVHDGFHPDRNPDTIAGQRDHDIEGPVLQPGQRAGGSSSSGNGHSDEAQWQRKDYSDVEDEGAEASRYRRESNADGNGDGGASEPNPWRAPEVQDGTSGK